MGTAERRVSTIDEATFAQASDRGRRLLARGPLATATLYKTGRIQVELNNGCAFEFPVAQAEGLAGASLRSSASSKSRPPVLACTGRSSMQTCTFPLWSKVSWARGNG